MSLAALLRVSGLADDTGQNLPETRATLLAQQRALREQRQRAQMFPAGTKELPLPDGMERVETPRGVFHFDPRQATRAEIETASAAGRENDVLGLGPASKAEVMAHAAAGRPLAAIVERDSDGNEVKAAIATAATADQTAAEMNARRAPENRVQAEGVPELLAGRTKPRNGSGMAALWAAASHDGGLEPRAAQAPGPRGAAHETANAFARGALDQGAGSVAEGAARGAGAANLAVREQVPGTELAGLVTNLQRLKVRRRELAGDPSQFSTFASEESYPAPAVDDKVLDEMDRDIAALEHRIAAARTRVTAPTERAAAGVQRFREGVRAAYPVNDSFAHSMAAGVAGGLGQALAMVPAMISGLGLPASTAQLFDQGYQDARASGVGEETAITAGVANLPAAALEYAANKVELGGMFKALKAGRIAKEELAREILRRGAQAIASGGGANAAQQLWQNAVAQKLYAPDRDLAEGVAQALAVGGVTSGLMSASTTAGAHGLRKLIETAREPAGESKSAARDATQTEATGPEVFPENRLQRPKLGRPAEAVAAAIDARPAEQFKPDLSRMEGADVDLVSQLARYGDLTRKLDDDFPAFAERMTARFGDKVQAYLAPAWDAVSGARPVRDLVPTENPLQLENAWKRAAGWGRLFWQGSADVLRKAGVNSLADAVERHVDFADRNLGKAWGLIKPAVDSFQGVGGLVHHGRAAQAFDQFAAFYRARENGRTEEAAKILATATPDTRALIDGVGQMFRYTGAENRRIGVRVRDRDGGLRPIGYLGADNFPRMLREDILAVLRDPSSNPQLWEQMRAELARNGNIPTRDDAAKFAHAAVPTETSSDHFGSLEKARRARLPEDWYEYRFEKVIPRYVSEWAERTAQIEAFGQKIAETDRDAFDVALGAVKNRELARYIEATRDHAYRVNRLSPTARKVMGNVTAVTSGLFLSNPYSTLRNLFGGVGQTVNQFGVRRAFARLPEAWRSIGDAEAAGALKADVADLIFHDDGSAGVRKGVGVALKLAGFNAAEQFVRAHNYLTAKTFLRDALQRITAAPDSRGSLQAQAFLRRYGMDPAKLAAESMHGPETERFLRGAVREAQGSYRYGQVPLFTNGPMGRFLLQFARWGTMATRFHARNTIGPAVLGETVPVRTAGGVRMKRVRTLLPLLRSPFVAMGAGALTFAARKALFGIDRPDATWDEVFRAMSEDEQHGVALALGHMVNDVVMGGTFGAITDYASMLKDAAERSRFKNPVEPPAASIVKETGLLAYKLAQQGTLSAQDYREWAARLVTAYRYGAPLAYRFSDALGIEWKAARRYQAELDRRFVRNAGRRFAEEAGYDVAGGVGGLPNVTENSPIYDALEDALHEGDAAAVRHVIRERMTSARTERERAERLRQLRTSALGRQPMKPGGSYAAAEQAAFRAWMRRRLSPEDRRRIEDTQRRYFETGRRAGLFTDRNAERYTAEVTYER